MSERHGGRVDPPDPPINANLYDISVKVPDEVVSDGRIHTYLQGIAEQINESDAVQIWHDDDDPVRRDDAGSYWVDATMKINYYIGSCPGRRPEEPGDEPGDPDLGEDGDEG
jgi:hypothetical protein